MLKHTISDTTKKARISNSNSNSDSNSNSNSKAQIKNINQLRFLGRFGEKLTPFFQTNKPNGYAVIILVLMFFYVGFMFVQPIIVTTGRQLRDNNIFYAKRLADRTGFATTSAIRNHITDYIHGKTKQQLIKHLILNRSGQGTYTCQNQLVPTIQNGGNLMSQFGICDPQGLLTGLDGDTNKTVDFLNALYPTHKKQLDDKYMENMRKSLIEQYKNDYDYTLRNTYVGQERLVDTKTGERINRYHFMTRADIETRTYFQIVNHVVAYFDTIVDDKYYPLPFNGTGNNCNSLEEPTSDELVVPDLVITQPDGSTVLCGGGVDCQPLGVKVVEGDPPVEHFFPYGSPEYQDACGTTQFGQPDPYCGQGSAGGVNGNSNCGTSQGGDLNCDLGNGVTYVGYVKSANIRPRRGCVSMRTGQQVGRGEIDPDGYTFTVTTRLVSFGSTFN